MIEIGPNLASALKIIAVAIAFVGFWWCISRD